MAGVRKKAPVLRPELQMIYQAFFALDSHRYFHASGYQPLAHSEIVSFMNEECKWLPRSWRPRFFRFIRALDTEYLSIKK